MEKLPEKEILSILDAYWEGWLNGVWENPVSFLDEDVRIIGSTKEEIYHNKAEATKYFQESVSEIAGKLQFRNRRTELIPVGDLVMTEEHLDLFIDTGETWNFYSSIRVSSLFRQNGEEWKIIQQHGSVPDSKVGEGETVGFEQVSKENRELRDAIKRRTAELEYKNRELEIETALERVRAQVTGMQESADLLDIVVTMRSEFVKLGHQAHYFWHMRWLPESYQKAMTSGDGSRIGMVMELPRHIHGDIPLLAKWEKGQEPTVVYAMDAEAAVDYVDKMVSLGNFQQVDPQAPGPDAIRAIGGLTFVMARTTHGEIGFSLPGEIPNPPADALDTLVRFARVFDLAYRRFEDLKESERQKREAEIELALERVRARTMAMQNSKELADAAFVLFEQLRGLGGNLWGTGFGLCEKNSEADQFWFAYEKGVLPPASVPNTTDPAHKKMYQGWKSKKDYLAIEASGANLKKHYEYMMSLPEVRPFFQEILDKGLAFPEWQQWNAAYFRHGYLLVITLEPYPEPDILKRFAAVFDQTYTRFLDLKKAEAQARESKIQLGLERVRARAMAMQNSDELDEVLSVLCEQFDVLEIYPMSTHMTVFDFENNTFTFRETGKFGNRSFGEQTVALDAMDTWKDTVDQWKAQKASDINRLHFPRESLPEVWEVFHETFASQPKDFRITPDDYPDGIYHTAGKHPYGYIGMNQIRPATPAEEEIVLKFAREFGVAYTRFLDLKKAEAQAREAEIQLALERVRAATMAMHHSEELSDVLSTLFEQYTILGINPSHAVLTLINKEKNTLNFRTTGRHGHRVVAEQEVDLKVADAWVDTTEKWKKSTPNAVNVNEYPPEILPEVWEVYGEILAAIPEEAQPKIEHFPNGLFITEGYCRFGYIGFAHDRRPTEEEKEIVRRLAAEFGTLYQRFLDLKKAEVQAREAQIEASLERVRSQTMAMHHSSDLEKSAMIVFEELEKLDLSIERSGIGIFDAAAKSCKLWTTVVSHEGKKELVTGVTSLTIHPMLIGTFDAWEAQEPLSYVLEGKELKEYYDIVSKSEFILSDQLLEKSASLPKEYYHYTPFGAGGLYFFSDSEPPAADIQIMRRFAEVFDMTYTRYEDLKKAEQQAREAQIEAALEKVRSRTMAMQHSDELPEAANVLFLEVQALGIPAWSCGYNILAADKMSASCIMSSEGAIQKPFKLRLKGETSFDQFGEFVRGDENFMVQELGGKALVAHYDFMKSFPDLQPIFEEIEQAGLSLPTYQINHLCKFNHGFLLFITYEPVPEAHDLFKRFTAVFDQTYTRFLDLKNMEAQARESKIETALERVRARALAMQEPEELKEVAQVLRLEMGLLGVEELETSSIYINDAEAQKAECWFAIKDLREEKKEMVTDHFALDLNDTWVGREMLKFYETADDRVSILMKGDARKEWIAYCETHSEAFQGYYGEVIPERTYHLYKFSHGAIGAATPGALSEESWNLLRRAASVFSLAYSRFKDLTQARLDLQRLKEEKKRAEDALKELQLTQQQLVHAEKMASLGELTAGIAHEIQNPLNFVNNFSDVSRELLEEMIDELKNGDVEEVDAIARDVIQNLEKIVHHGQRADSIVKGMLQHSRSGDGKKEATDLNALADEYLRLAYHGLRAKDKSFNAHMETDFDPDLPKAHVIPQDIGRVLLNLITNAFHAVSERKEKEPEGFEPTVWVQTRKTEGGIALSVRDNGGGIPDTIKDKIFQPFFTTKPTGEGTGLGLSMSYDIVTKGHGGDIKVYSKPEAGSEFTIIL